MLSDILEDFCLELALLFWDFRVELIVDRGLDGLECLLLEKGP